MDSARFAYDLPDEAIAQHPASPRDRSRLLVAGDPVRHLRTADIAQLIRPGDAVVLNDTRVMPARLTLHKPTGAAVEVLALEPKGGDGWWEAMVRNSRRVATGTRLVDDAGVEVVEVGPATGEGTRLVRPVCADAMASVLEKWGAVPLPPYISAPLDDPERYQTVFADRASSVAAPTAGLHLTAEAIERCRAVGADVVTVELSVGVGTFRPIEVDDLADHRMHSELYRVAGEVWERIESADRVVAVGTTVVRTLESVAATGVLEGRTELFIAPGYRFGIVDALLTNFHMPRSSLLVMIEAFIGPCWRDLYALALDEGYRFLSFGDAMFLERAEPLERPPFDHEGRVRP